MKKRKLALNEKCLNQNDQLPVHLKQGTYNRKVQISLPLAGLVRIWLVNRIYETYLIG
jgi:hypothetical protein